MGSICSINTNPKTWPAISAGHLTPEYGGGQLLQITYGWFDDDPSGAFELKMYMRASIYERLLKGEYKVPRESNMRRKLIIVDAQNNFVAPLLDEFCY